jgi:nucleoside-diphosphate-sugar epimerase
MGLIRGYCKVGCGSKETSLIIASGKTGTIGRYLPNTVLSENANLADVNLLNTQLRIPRNSVFLHLAGIVGEAKVSSDLQLSEVVNFKSIGILAEKVLESPDSKIIYVSTGHVYGGSELDISEDFPINPRSMYADQKARAEAKLIELFRHDEERLLILRVFSILDFGMPNFTLGGRIENIIDGKFVGKLKFTDDIRDFLAPRQVANNLFKIASSSDLSGVYNLCSGTGTSVRDAFLRMANLKEDEDDFTEKGNTETPRIVGSNLKILRQVPKLETIWDISNRGLIMRNDVS